MINLTSNKRPGVLNFATMCDAVCHAYSLVPLADESWQVERRSMYLRFDVMVNAPGSVIRKADSMDADLPKPSTAPFWLGVATCTLVWGCIVAAVFAVWG